MEQFAIDPTIAYDVVELPSRGIYYKNNKKSVKVSFLTAADENILSSNTLLASGSMTNELLKRKNVHHDLKGKNPFSDEEKRYTYSNKALIKK